MMLMPGRVNAEANASAVSATKRAVTSPQVAVFKDIVIFQRIVGLQPRKITGNSSNAGLYRAIALLTSSWWERSWLWQSGGQGVWRGAVDCVLCDPAFLHFTKG